MSLILHPALSRFFAPAVFTPVLEHFLVAEDSRRPGSRRDEIKYARDLAPEFEEDDL